MTVSLPRELEEYIERKVKAGVYRDTGELVCEAVRQLSEQDNDWNKDTAELRTFLLEAVRSRHRPLRLGELEQVERRVLAEEAPGCR
jgi:putative addiction module CopG family antidote